ncbi:hypothetical protein WA026_015989 [Henosepilachna vigintioctopunctata]|uniref:Uncharacterized protein n=1 Tax=Henosepilachna vigintioctopunctata TaxID=420089 RepID=A0AAW1U3A1_9CUCU
MMSEEPTPSEDKLSSSFGLTMLCANVFIFLFSIIFRSVAKLISSVIRKEVMKSEQVTTTEPIKLEQVKPLPPEIKTKLDPIPSTTSETVIKVKKVPTTESSCPNLSSPCKGQLDQSCQTIFHAPIFTKQEQTLKSECAKLREEVLSVRSTSLKEHALLSRKLDSMAKEKREISKRLGVVQKENQVAKHQLDEMMEERKSLQKRLDNATKEFRVNTKTKKVALAKLEEISATVDDLKRQLEQVTRDKQILQGKLEMLRNEYEQIQERMRMMQLKEARMCNDRSIAMDTDRAERDETRKDEEKLNIEESTCESSQCSLIHNLSKESIFLPYVISQTEVDMKNIQTKILQLENSLKEFTSKSDSACEIGDITNESKLEMKKILSLNEPERLEELSNDILSRTGSDVTCRKTYDEIKVDMLRSALKEKIRVLENIKEKGDDSSVTFGFSETTFGDEDLDKSSEENISASRIVSNSEAFQRFLKSIGADMKVEIIGDSLH